jgi:hypothetical protein
MKQLKFDEAWKPKDASTVFIIISKFMFSCKKSEHLSQNRLLLRNQSTQHLSRNRFLLRINTAMIRYEKYAKFAISCKRKSSNHLAGNKRNKNTTSQLVACYITTKYMLLSQFPLPPTTVLYFLNHKKETLTTRIGTKLHGW